ncbi:MAG: hypothetical protein ACXVJD_04745 [Mucilaginibacter sp.]
MPGIIFLLSGEIKHLAKATDSAHVLQVSAPDTGLIAKFKPVIQGVWVKKDYIDKIARSKSPAAAANLAEGITTIYFDTGKIQGDSLVANAAWGNHEGGNITLYFKRGKRPGVILLGKDNLGYTVSGKHALLIIYHTEKGKTTAVKYVKALNKQPDDRLDAGMNYLINSALVAGDYTATDSAGKQTPVSFTKSGQVSGFGGFKTYFLKNDIGGEPMNNLDEIVFNFRADKNSRRNFAYKIKGNALLLYDSHPNADSTALITGKRVYQLVRQHKKSVKT